MFLTVFRPVLSLWLSLMIRTTTFLRRGVCSTINKGWLKSGFGVWCEHITLYGVNSGPNHNVPLKNYGRREGFTRCSQHLKNASLHSSTLPTDHLKRKTNKDLKQSKHPLNIGKKKINQWIHIGQANYCGT